MVLLGRFRHRAGIECRSGSESNCNKNDIFDRRLHRGAGWSDGGRKGAEGTMRFQCCSIIDGKPLNFDGLAERIRAARKEQDRTWKLEYDS
jgi:hypothetical protein